ncbi:MAG: amino acid permease [Myxococcales bacterium]|nr:amino acid permease [Myxococcales bacterium]
MQETMTGSASPEPGAPAGAAVRPLRRVGMITAAGLVVASMVGTGVFTTTGFLAADIPSPVAILLCWALGGLAAWCGAVSFAELGAALPDNGGEYRFISSLVHPAVGFASALCSFVVGFAAPLAMMAHAFGKYLVAAWFPAPEVAGAPPPAVGVAPEVAGALLIVLVSLVHMGGMKGGSRFQNAATAGKVLLILAFIVIGIVKGDASYLAAPGPEPLWRTLLSPAFAMSLMWVSFSYSGWNAAAYLAGEIERPARVLPAATLLGTLAVAALYVALNAVFLASAPLSSLAGVEAVADASAKSLLGDAGGRFVSVLIALGLVSTVGALVVTGPRIYAALADDMPRLRLLAWRDPERGPRVAIALQTAVALVLLWTSSFEALLSYVGFTLSIFAAIGVGCVFVLRHRRKHVARPYRMPLYPLPPLLFIALMLWTVVQAVRAKPLVVVAGLGTVVLGVVLYLVTRQAPPGPARRG